MSGRSFAPRAALCGIAILTAVGGCGDDVPDAGTANDATGLPDGEDQARTSGSVGSQSDTAGASTADPAGTADTGFPPAAAECGNGFVEADEQCDDANRVDDDGCSNACRVPCGLDFAVIVLPPTDESVITAEHVAVTPDDGAVVAGLLQVITTDQRGNAQVDPDVAQVLRVAADGRRGWTVNVDNPDGGLVPTGVVVDAAGDVVLAATGDDPDGADGIFVVKLDGDDGTEVWRHAFAGTLPGQDDQARGLALAPNGDLAVVGQTRVGDGDDDVWVRRLSAADGTEVWTASYSGVGTGMFSIDDGGPVAVDAAGRAWVLGVEYVDFETQVPVLLRFAAEGGDAEVAVRPTLPGTEQRYFAVDVATGGDGLVYAVYGRVLGSAVQYRVAQFDGEGTPGWALDQDAFVAGPGSDLAVAGVATLGDEIVVAGRVSNDVTIEAAAWDEVWVARVRDDATLRCQSQYGGPVTGLLPPSITAADLAVASDAHAFVSGLQSLDGDIALWLGRFAPE